MKKKGLTGGLFSCLSIIALTKEEVNNLADSLNFKRKILPCSMIYCIFFRRDGKINYYL